MAGAGPVATERECENVCVSHNVPGRLLQEKLLVMKEPRNPPPHGREPAALHGPGTRSAVPEQWPWGQRWGLCAATAELVHVEAVGADAGVS